MEHVPDLRVRLRNGICDAFVKVPEGRSSSQAAQRRRATGFSGQRFTLEFGASGESRTHMLRRLSGATCTFLVALSTPPAHADFDELAALERSGARVTAAAID